MYIKMSLFYCLFYFNPKKAFMQLQFVKKSDFMFFFFMLIQTQNVDIIIHME